MLFSVPLTMVVKIALEGSEETRWLAILLGPDSGGDIGAATASVDSSSEPPPAADPHGDGRP